VRGGWVWAAMPEIVSETVPVTCFRPPVISHSMYLPGDKSAVLVPEVRHPRGRLIRKGEKQPSQGAIRPQPSTIVPNPVYQPDLGLKISGCLFQP
jgi:hypothetical protein